MANVILPIGAGILGTIYFGPTGGALAYTIVAGLTAETQELPPPAIGELRLQTSSYGTPIVNCIGKQRVAGNVIWAEDKQVVESTTKVGKGLGGGAEQTTITYTISCAIAICEGPILGVKRVWSDGTLIVDGTSGAKPMPGTLYLGSDSQTADPTIEAVEGSGNVPGFRGLAYMVLTDFNLGPSGRLPNFSFEVLRQGADL
jgi:hypothetical protein